MQIPSSQLYEALGHATADKRLDILRRIGVAGSISEAARGAGVSYKAAWQAIETLTNLAGTALVEKTTGGTGGGGAVLTPAGRHILLVAGELAAARQRVLARLDHAHPGLSATGLATLGLRTSMRNQLPCEVLSLDASQGSVLVELGLPAGQRLRSKITQESSQLLGLRPGLPALALFKAAAVTIAPRVEPATGLNVLAGTVARVAPRAGGEATLRLNSGLQVVGFASGPATALARGGPAQAGVAAAAVVIALPD